MLNLINFSCVKNVYYMFNINSKSSVNISTYINLNIKTLKNWVQNLQIKQVYKSFTSTQSTINFLKNNLLNKSFTHYPHSLLLRLKNEI
jgi:hypothetical protein